MGCGGSKHESPGTVNRALRRGDEGMVWLKEHLANIDPEKKDGSGTSPLCMACKVGRVDAVELFLTGPFGGQVAPASFSEALWHCCKGETNTAVAKVLLDSKRWGGRCADPNWCDRQNMDTPLHHCMRKRKALKALQLAERCYVAQLLCRAGARFDMQNMHHLTPLELGMETEFERGCITLVKGGANLTQVQKYLKDHPHNATNWVSSSLLSKFAFKHPQFVASMKAKFMSEFDPDGSGELDRKELLHFIAFHVKMGFQNGYAPVTEFDDKEGTLDLPTIERLLKQRCPDLIAKYESLDTDGDGTYTWDELLPISADFYSKLWAKGRPENAGLDEFAGPKEEAEMKAKYEPLVKAQYDVSILSHTVERVHPRMKGGKKGSKYAAQPMISHTTMAKPSQRGGGEPLPANWKAATDPKTGKTYFHNTVTKKTRWKRPTEDDQD